MVLEKQTNTFLGGPSTSKYYSDKMAQDVDAFIKNLLDERYKSVLASLREYEEVIENMVEQLFKKETLDGKEVRELISNFEKSREEV
jgi:cell division protease FtsH